ncbi:MAG TPA: RelA/SpoT domain-containing protein [Solirubrobacterales bacterium]
MALANAVHDLPLTDPLDLCCPDMATWTEPRHSRSSVDKAGACYIDPKATQADKDKARLVINNWRSSHSFPLNTLQMNLRSNAAQIDVDPTVAQRIKRLPSIRHKLERIPGMKLSRMQDLGGCRAVMSNVEKVTELLNFYRDKAQMKHKLVRQDLYIWEPKESGYRGVHLVYGYHSDKKDTYNDLKIELQLRSQLQHGWATAVETVGTFTEQALKSSMGDEGWLRFFALMSSALALREETPLVPGTPEDPGELIDELREYASQLQVVDRLSAYGAALQHVEQHLKPGAKHTFLLELNLSENVLRVSSYTDTTIAAMAYSSAERKTEGDPMIDVVLVSADSVASLKRAYPNYFLDTTAFLASLSEAVDGSFVYV